MAKAQQSPSYRSVPSLLRDLREAAGLTQRELGARLGRRHSYVYNSETGNRRIDVAEFAVWCRACAADPLQVFATVVADLPSDPPALAPRGKSKKLRPRKVR